MGKTGAEHQRKFRAKIRADPEKNARLLSAEAAAAKRRRVIKKESMTEAELEMKRSYDRDRKRLQREKGKSALKVKLPFGECYLYYIFINISNMY